MPETFELDAGPSSAATLTPYEALSVAVRNEQQAFRFYSYLAAIAEDDRIRARAEVLAKEELDHVVRLRARRRQAYHTEGRRPRPRPRAHDMPSFRSLAYGLEQGTWRVRTAAALSLEAAGDVKGALLLRRSADVARVNADALSAAGISSQGLPTQSVQAADRSGRLAAGALAPRQALLLALKDSEEKVETYLDIAEHTRSEAVLAEAQRRCAEVVTQLSILAQQLAATDALFAAATFLPPGAAAEG